MTKPEHPARGWTLETIFTYFDSLISGNDRLYGQRFDSGDRAVNAAMAAANAATSKAESAVEKRLEGLNELRGMAVDQGRLLMPRLEQEKVNQTIVDRIVVVENMMRESSSRKSGSRDSIAYIIAGAGLLIAAVEAIALILRK